MSLHIKAALGQATERLDTEMEKLRTSQLPVVIGILTDKAQTLDGARQEPTVQVNVQINADTRSKDQVIAGLFGNAVGPHTQTHSATESVNSDSLPPGVKIF